jgi:L-ascorbate metabolism protein UlaG (beta-lactamase superfamily)
MLIGDKTILFDPVFSNTASPISFISPKRFSQKAIEISDLPHIDAIVISHDHYDHLDYKTIKELKVKTDKFFVPLGVAAHLISWGIEEKNISELAWRESTKFGEISFTAMPSQHFSGRGLNDRNSTLWCSWVIQYQDKNLFFGGDSGYDENVSREIGEKFGPFDLTILECGQYNEQWHAIHSFPEETAQANILLKGKYLLPIHWAAFKLSVHDWDEPINRISKASNSLNINLTTPKIGEAVEINKNYPNSKWWFK